MDPVLSSGWDWWMRSDAGLLARVAVGLLFFGSLGLWDVLQHGRSGRRWREYAFLFFCAILAMAYGVANDLVTSAISWEYFYYGKGIDQILGPQTPPAPGRLAWEAVKVGMKASWSAGLVIAVVLLLANNPGKRNLLQLRNRELARLLAPILTFVILFACLSGWVGYLGGWTWISSDFADLVQADQWRPRRFLAVFGAHLGAYAGGLIAAGVAAWTIRRRRRRLR